jgi:hypothetical protein
MFEDGKVGPTETLFRTVDEPDTVTVLRSCRSICDYADAPVRPR